MKKMDFILIVGFLLIGVVIAFLYLASNRKGSQVIVSVDGTEVHKLSLDEDGEYEILGADGGTNLLKIEDGYASVIEASCPDHICMNMGRINSSNQSIVCLPNKVVVYIDGADESVDIIAK